MIGAYKTHQNRTCIVVHANESRVLFIRLQEPMVTEHSGLESFTKNWTLMDTPVAEAARRFSNSFLSRDPGIQRHLNDLIGDTEMAAKKEALDKDVAAKAAKVAGKTAHAKAYAIPTTPSAEKSGKGKATEASDEPKASRSAIRDDMKISKMIVKENPKRPGSMAHANYARYAVGVTVADLIAGGSPRHEIAYDVKCLRIELK